MYHTTCKINVNGSRVDLFINNIFDKLCEKLTTDHGEINILNNSIQTYLSQLRNCSSETIRKSIAQEKNKKERLNNHDEEMLCIEQTANTEVNQVRSEICMRKKNEQLETKGEQSNLAGDINITSPDNFICPYCDKYVEEGIGCDRCDYWYHYKCENLSSKIGENELKQLEYICTLYGNDVTIAKSGVHLGLTRAENNESHINVQERIQLARRTTYALMGSGCHGTNGLDPPNSYQIYKTYVISRQITTNFDNKSSFFSRVMEILDVYELPTIIQLQSNIPKKEQWKRTIKLKVDTFWKDKALIDSERKSSLKFMNTDNFEINKHYKVCKVKHLPRFELRKAIVKTRMIIGTYILQAYKHKFTPYAVEPICQLCNTDNEDITDFLTTFLLLSSTREKYFIEIRKEITDKTTPAKWNCTFKNKTAIV
ncbi:MLL1 [Mytilus coruscus]|uniref:MLL1 n=1 Tax=Mytilus coruscus TaxID=42192 RepID=A0A6J8E4Y1_MYTCO|nr:MLL1 [Mytilus coruscus]